MHRRWGPALHILSFFLKSLKARILSSPTPPTSIHILLVYAGGWGPLWKSCFSQNAPPSLLWLQPSPYSPPYPPATWPAFCEFPDTWNEGPGLEEKMKKIEEAYEYPRYSKQQASLSFLPVTGLYVPAHESHQRGYPSCLRCFIVLLCWGDNPPPQAG